MASQKSAQTLKCLDGWRVRAGASREQPAPQGARVRMRAQAHGMAPRTAALLLLLMMMELAAAAAAGSGATPRALKGAAASPDTKRLLARLWRVHPRHAAYKEQRRPMKLVWAGAYEGNRSRFDHAVGRSEADVSYAGGATAQRWCPPLVERFGNMAVRRAARGVLPFYYRDGDTDSTALLGEGERAVLEAAKPSKGAINTSAAHEALVRALGGEGTLAMDGLLQQPPLSVAFGFVASSGGSARPTDEMGYDEARAAPSDAYSRAYRDTSVFQLQFWRDPLSGGGSSGNRHDGQGGPEAEGADLPAAVTAYVDFWSRTVTPLGAYVAAYVGCAPFPDVLANVDWAHAAVVHFRCSDVPFESQAFAHLESLEYADFLGARFAATHAAGHDGPPVKEVVPVLCTYHSSKRTAEAAAAQTRLAQYKCPSFLDAYLERIQAAYANGMREQRLTHPDGGAAVRLTIRPPVCVDERATLRAMLEARMAALLFRSSFGFVACAPKGREGCIMPWLGQWELRVHPKGEVLPPERAEAVAAAMPWTMRAGAGLPHPARHSNSARREAAWDAFDLRAASRNASSSSSGTIAEE